VFSKISSLRNKALYSLKDWVKVVKERFSNANYKELMGIMLPKEDK